MSQTATVDEVSDQLRQELAEDAKVMTDLEDKFVYANERYFAEYENATDEEQFPDLVVRVLSDDDAETATEILDSAGFDASLRGEWSPEDANGADAIGLIDATDTWDLPADISEQTRAMELTDLRLEQPHDESVYSMDHFEEQEISKGYCPINQTAYGDVETYSAKGRLMTSRELTADTDGPLEHSTKVSNILYSCASCGNCFRTDSMDMDGMWKGLVEGKRRIVEERDGEIPSNFRDVFQNTFQKHNPLGMAEHKRDAWTEDVDVEVPILEPGDETDLLFFVGCQPSYDDRNQELAKSLARIFDALDLDWGILGNDESCSGNHQRVMGEEGLFEMQVERNSETLAEIEYDTLITGDPHSYHSLKTEYQAYDVDLDPVHYTEFLVDRIEDEELEATHEGTKVVTYHDSCYLGTHNDITAEPRDLLQALPGYEFRDINSQTLCCGGGGGRMWFEDEYTDSRVYEPVVESALDVDVDTLALACPFCVTHFEDARKTMDVEEEFNAKDISELIAEALKSITA
jgi:Fe-S oxidoreductase